VLYDVIGHTIFLEDGAETQNRIEYNLVVLTKQTFSMLIIDSTPASFWIKHPDNILVGNHAAGSEHYGFWYDPTTHPTGPSVDKNICPKNEKLGEFRNNTSHSNNKYGLRIHDSLLPRTYPCSAMSTDPNDEDNKHILAKFEDFLTYKNRRNGVIAERLGYVQFHNFKVADSAVGGMEVSLTENIDDGYAKIVGAMIVGRSENSEDWTDD
jgi:cell migration-inducing and hyaluronan-binding protein